MIKEGFLPDLIVALIYIAIALFSISRVRSGKAPGIKRYIPALDGVKEGVGVCAELGRPLHFGTGPGALQTNAGSEVVAAMAILDFTARLCARSRVPIYLSVFDSPSIVYGNQILTQAYRAEGQEDILPPDAVRYYGQTDTSLGYGIVRTFKEVNSAANYMIGAWDASTSINAEEANIMGQFQVGGGALHFKGALPFFVATCEYTFIAEELYAASALLNQDESMMATILSSDYMRFLIIGVSLIGILLATIGSTILEDLLV